MSSARKDHEDMQISIKNISFKSSNGTDTVSAVAYYPEVDPVRAVVLVCHGMVEHIGRYRDFMLFLAHHGIAALGHDQLGHGKTAPDPASLGYFAHQDGYQSLIRDMHQTCRIAENMFPGCARFLLGHSMGSLVARLYSVKYPDTISGAVYLGTPGPNTLTGVGMMLAQHTVRKAGKFSRPQLLQKMTLGDMNKRFTPVRTPKDWLTREETQVDRYIADPLCDFTFTAQGFADLFCMLEIVNSRKWAVSYPKGLPTLILSGDCDPVGNFGRGVLQVYNSLLAAGAEDLTFQLYEGARHELLNETNREEVYGDILGWIEPRL